jgi:hypothetical protein
MLRWIYELVSKKNGKKFRRIRLQIFERPMNSVSSQPFIKDNPLINSENRIVKNKMPKAEDISFDRRRIGMIPYES